MPTPQVSVIVPAKDAASFLPDCLTSLTRQFSDPGRLEVIVVDDGSSDGTGDVARGYAERLPGLRVLRHETARGLATARNAGLAASTGTAIAYLDADDWLRPGYLPAVVEQLHELDVDFVRTDHVQVSGATRTLHRAPWGLRDQRCDPRAAILPHDQSTMVDYCYAWAGVFHRRVAPLLPFDDGLHTAEDRPWAWRLHLQASSFAVSNLVGVCYRRDVATSLTQLVDARQLHFSDAFHRVFDVAEADAEAARMWPKAARMALAIVAHHLRRRGLMSRPVRQELVGRSRALVGRIPPTVWDEVWDDFTPERQLILGPLFDGTHALLMLPGWAGERRAEATPGRKRRLAGVGR